MHSSAEFSPEASRLPHSVGWHCPDAVVGPLISLVPVTARRVLLKGGGSAALEPALKARLPQIEVAREAHEDGDVFDAVVLISEDPEADLLRIPPLLGDASVCVVLLPNLHHWRSLEDLLAGRAYRPRGWDALGFRELMSRVGLPLTRILPAFAGAEMNGAAAKALDDLASALRVDPQTVRQRMRPSHFAGKSRGSKPLTEPPIRVTGATLASKAEAIGIVRMHEPLQALGTLPGFEIGQVSQAPRVTGADRAKPRDIFVWQRPIMKQVDSFGAYRTILSSHRLLVVEFDDHPMRWPAIGDNNHLTFRSAHAVRTSTDALASIIREWNPEVFVSPNQIEALPPFRPVEERRGPVKLIFAALNRKEDWEPHLRDLNEVIGRYGPDRLEVDVVFDRELYDALETRGKRFHDLLPLAHYKALMSQADIAWLPLKDTLFNRCKSDLKYIECAAHSVAVLASPVVYGDAVRHGETGLLYSNGKKLRERLLSLIEEPGRRAALVRAAHDEVARTRLRAHHTAGEAAWYRSLVARRDELEAARRERLLNEHDWQSLNQAS